MPIMSARKVLVAATLASTALSTAAIAEPARDRQPSTGDAQRVEPPGLPATAARSPGRSRSAALATTGLLRTGPAVDAEVARPLLASNQRPACSNQVSKGGDRPRCDREEVIAEPAVEVVAADGAEAAVEVAVVVAPTARVSGRRTAAPVGKRWWRP